MPLGKYHCKNCCRQALFEAKISGLTYDEKQGIWIVSNSLFTVYLTITKGMDSKFTMRKPGRQPNLNQVLQVNIAVASD